MLKKSIWVLFLVILFNQGFSWGIGIFLGEPNGISGAFDRFHFLAGWDFSSTASLQLCGDYWFLNDELGQGVRYYVGIGARFFLENQVNRNVTIPGWDWGSEFLWVCNTG